MLESCQIIFDTEKKELIISIGTDRLIIDDLRTNDKGKFYCLLSHYAQTKIIKKLVNNLD